MRTRIAVAQAGGALFDPDAALGKVDAMAREASREGAGLLVFPEAFIGGYPKGMTFDVTIGSRTDAGRELYRRYHAGAIDVPGAGVSRLEEIAAAERIDLVVGVIERDGGTLYCTSLFVRASVGLVAKHRKLLPTAAERYIWGQGDGSTLSTMTTDYGTVGSAICWENYMPLLRSAMYAKGVTLWCAPTVDARPSWSATMQHIALEGRCFVLSANQYMTRDDLPDDLADAHEGDDVLIGGGSMIVSPLGRVLAGPKRDGEGLLVAEIDTDDIIRSKFDLDAVGHYSRPDVFSLSVRDPRTET